MRNTVEILLVHIEVQWAQNTLKARGTGESGSNGRGQLVEMVGRTGFRILSTGVQNLVDIKRGIFVYETLSARLIVAMKMLLQSKCKYDYKTSRESG